MKRREFLGLGVTISAGLAAVKGLSLPSAWAEDKKAGGAAGAAKITEKDIYKENPPGQLPNYCQTPDKQPNKFCADWKSKPGHCKTCMFYNKDNSETTFKGGKYARCQLLADPKKPQFVSEKAWCATFTADPTKKA